MVVKLEGTVRQVENKKEKIGIPKVAGAKRIKKSFAALNKRARKVRQSLNPSREKRRMMTCAVKKKQCCVREWYINCCSTGL